MERTYDIEARRILLKFHREKGQVLFILKFVRQSQLATFLIGIRIGILGVFLRITLLSPFSDLNLRIPEPSDLFGPNSRIPLRRILGRM